jgi:hypothetical protein
MTGEWDKELVVKEYDEIKAGDLKDDPANYAVENGLVDVHTDDSRAIVGAWRWKGLSIYRKRIVELLQSHRSIDFGGAAGPVGYGAIVVDMYAEYKAPWDVPGDVGCVFTSHTLEHIPDLYSCIAAITYRLSAGGYLVAFVPSYRSVHLRAENFPHHCHTFRLSADANCDDRWLPLDAILEGAYELEHKSHVDGSILIIGKRK